MRRFVVHSTALGIVLASALSWTAIAFAQWIKYPTDDVPTTTDGRRNLSAPTPQIPHGKPDFSGIGLTGNPNCPRSLDRVSLNVGPQLHMSHEGISLGVSL